MSEMTMGEERACQTPMSDHVSRFWELVTNEFVHVVVNIQRLHDEGQPPHWDSSTFGNDVMKAIVATLPVTVQLQARPADGGDWVDIYPAQLAQMAKQGLDVRATESFPVTLTTPFRYGANE